MDKRKLKRRNITVDELLQSEEVKDILSEIPLSDTDELICIWTEYGGEELYWQSSKMLTSRFVMLLEQVKLSSLREL